MGGIKSGVFCGLDLQREGVQTSHKIRQPWVETLLSTYIQGNRLSGVELVYLISKPLPLISVSKIGQNRPWDTGMHAISELALEGKRSLNNR